jgi:hypothetical protein
MHSSLLLLNSSTKLGNLTANDVEWRSSFVFGKHNFANDSPPLMLNIFLLYIYSLKRHERASRYSRNQWRLEFMSSKAHAMKNQLIPLSYLQNSTILGGY